MCNCKNVTIGSYDNQVRLKRPDFMSKNKTTVCIDTCLVDEILYLWAHGIYTGGCCCGHNAIPASIAVIGEDSVKKMKELGYVVQYNPSCPDAEWLFYSKKIPFPISTPRRPFR